MKKKAAAAAISFINHAKCAFLTILLIGFLLANPLLSRLPYWDNLLWSGFYLTMIFAPWFVAPRRKILIFSIVVGLFFLALRSGLTIYSPPLTEPFTLKNSDLGMVLMILMECLLTGVVIFYSLTVRGRESEPVWGCVLAYLLQAIVFADIYWLAAQNIPDAFAANGLPLEPSISDLLYFSFVSLTTCGYGDIAPLNPFVRQLAGLEAVLGVMYVALFVGRQLKLNTASPRS